MTDIVPAPDVRLSSEFPTNADRTAGVFNTKSNSWAITSRTMAADTDAAAKSARTNAIAANERAEAADASADDALAQANRAEGQADAAMGYRNTAGSHAATAAAQAGIATTKAQEAASSAAQANSYKNDTQIIAQQAVTDSAEQVALATAQAVRAEEAAESIAEGPITSLNVYSGLKTGAVTLALSDLGAQATDAQMQAGALATPLLISPAGVKAAVLANAPKTLVREQRTADAQLVKADTGKLIDITSGTFTQTFDEAATLGDGWWCYLKNSGFPADVYINGDFSSDTLWTKGSGWSISGGSANATNTSSALTSASNLIAGRKYRVNFTVSITSGTFGFQEGPSTLLVPYNGLAGTHFFEFVCSGPAGTAQSIQFRGSGFTGSVDNVVITDMADSNITLSPSASETIDGLASYVMYPGEVRLIQCDGFSLRSVVINPFSKTFIESGNFLRPPGYADFEGELWGGGSGGSAGAAGTVRLGGSGGGCAPFKLNEKSLLSIESVVIGAGGVGINNAAGNPGGSSSFAGVIAYGGDAVYGGNAYLSGAQNPAIASSSSNPTFSYLAGAPAVSGSSSVFGGMAGRGITAANALNTASRTVFGGQGGLVDAAGLTPFPGVAPGGGGAASITGRVSGAGARGELRIRGII